MAPSFLVPFIASFLCLVPPAAEAVRRSTAHSGNLRPSCPSFARSWGLADDECSCRPHTTCQDILERCYRKKYFKVTCTSCRCVQDQPTAVSNGTHLTVRGADFINLWRQGQVVHELAPVVNGSVDWRETTYEYPDDFMHKEYIVNSSVNSKLYDGSFGSWSSVESLAFVKKSNLCGVGLFTKPALDCTKVPATDGKPAFQRSIDTLLGQLAAPQEVTRGFGVEFELVGRNVTEELKKEVTEKWGFKYKIGSAYYNSAISLGRWVQQRRGKANESLDHTPATLDALLEKLGVLNVPALEQCFEQSITTAMKYQVCSTDSDCAITDFCMSCNDCHAKLAWTARGLVFDRLPAFMKEQFNYTCGDCGGNEDNICKPRDSCQEGLTVNGAACPIPHDKWQWTVDMTVQPLKIEEAEALKPAGDKEYWGAGFELVSPPPPYVPAGTGGYRSVLETMSGLTHMGVQAGTSSGMHVHVNVASDEAPGRRLTVKQIASVWAAFAQYQLVIDEMMSPSRIDNHYAQPLFVGKCKMPTVDLGGSRGRDGNSSDDDHGYVFSEPVGTDLRCSSFNPCACSKLFFRQMHTYVSDFKNALTGSIRDFCNAALTTGPHSLTPCDDRYPRQRYFALNMAALSRLGTLEFRAHASTYDSERVLRWIQFVTAFVDHFGTSTSSGTDQFFDGTVENDLEDLSAAQRDATADKLFAELRGKLASDTQEYYAERKWEQGAVGCDVTTPESETTVAERTETFLENIDLVQALGEQITVEKVRPKKEGEGMVPRMVDALR